MLRKSGLWLNQRMIEHDDIPKGDLGIELEIEGTFTSLPTNSKFWKAKGEGSLRNGFEFISNGIIPIKDLDRYVDKLFTYLEHEGTVLSPTIRCSTHVHVNVADFSFYEYFNVLFYYYLVEDILVGSQGPLRKGNLFCLRMSDAEQIVRNLGSSIKGRSGPYAYDQGSSKYAALNVAVFKKFGSIEFRFMRPLLDRSLMSLWCSELHRMVHKARKIPFYQSLIEAERMTTKEFLGLAFSPAFVDYLYEATPDGPPTKVKLMRNYDHLMVQSATLRHFARYSFGPESDQDEDSPFERVKKKHGLTLTEALLANHPVSDEPTIPLGVPMGATVQPTPPPSVGWWVDDSPETHDFDIDDDTF